MLFESGTIADGELEEKPEDDPEHDRQLTLFRDFLYGADGAPVHQFWQAAPSPAFPEGHRSLVLPAAAVRGTAHSIAAEYQLVPDRAGRARHGAPAPATGRARRPRAIS